MRGIACWERICGLAPRVRVVHPKLPGVNAPGIQVDQIVRELRGLSHARPGVYAPGLRHHEFPQDIIAQQYPGADVPKLPHDALVRIEGVTHTAKGRAIRSSTIMPGSLIIMATPSGTTAHDSELPFIVGQVVDTSCKRGMLVLAWSLPELARVENFRGGRKKQMLDAFGPWVPVDDMAAQTLQQCRLPDPIVNVRSTSILEANFTLTEKQTLPYDVLDGIRNAHSIDSTGFSMSMTRRGNVYRSYVLMRGV